MPKITNNNYTIISNKPVRDTSLSLEALGLLTRLLGLPNGAEIDLSVRGLAKIFDADVVRVAHAVEELEKQGYIVTYHGDTIICDSETEMRFENAVLEF